MRKKFLHSKRILACILGASLLTTAVPVTTVEAATTKTLQVGESVKFDFGGTKNVENGYVGVEATRNYFSKGIEEINTDSSTGYAYGFLGLGASGYLASDRADGERTDGYSMEPGMEITLFDGGAGAKSTDDYVYASQTIYNLEETVKEAAYNMADGTIPVRFALHVDPKSYYEVKATLANASETEDAVVSLYNERRHQIATNVELAPGATKEITFNAAVTDVYFQKSAPVGTYNDKQLNVTVAGKNAALAALEITRIEHQPTIFICSDSTGCDQMGYMPSYPLQNYTGVGQGITAYFQDVMVSNQGEGGLAANDGYHYNSAVAQLQAGDYLYVQYGHNHKNDGVKGYVNCLRKYYTSAHDKGAKLLLVGPIDRSQEYQYNASTNTWSSTLSGYSKAAEGYVTALIYGGLTAADAYVAAYQSGSSDADGEANAYAYLETLTAGGITSAGVTDAAFIDLNAPWLEFLASATAGNATVGVNKYSHVKYYFTYNQGGAKDLTHINDYGASQAGYIFATEMAKAYEAGIKAGEGTAEYIQAKALEVLYTDYKTNRADVTPDTVSDELIQAGTAPNSRYPQAFVPEEISKYPAAVTNITIKNKVFSTVDVQILSSMKSYGKVALKVYDENDTLLGTIWTTDWLDHTAMTAGFKATLHFEDTDIMAPSNGKCVAEVYPVSDDTQEYDGKAEAMSESYIAQLSNGSISVDLALGKTVTASGNNSGKNPETNIVDGNETTVWSPGSAGTANFVVDLGAVYAIDKAVLYTYDWYGFPYTIELSENGSDYEFFYEQPLASGTDYTTEVADPEEVGYGRYVKVTATKPDSRNWIGLADFKVYAYVEEEEVVVDKTELDTAITEADVFTEADYTKESWSVLQAALQKAKDVVGDANSTEEMVAAAISELQAAIKALEKAQAKEDITKEDITKEETKITLNVPAKITVGVGENVTLEATVTGEAADKPVTFETDKSKTVAVSKTGKITAKKTGTATITAKTADGKTATCKVTVKKAPKKVILKNKSKKLKKGQTFQIKVKKYSPANAASYKVKYTSNKKKVASVSETGLITAKKKGIAKITVKTYNGKKATFKVTVK